MISARQISRCFQAAAQAAIPAAVVTFVDIEAVKIVSENLRDMPAVVFMPAAAVIGVVTVAPVLFAQKVGDDLRAKKSAFMGLAAGVALGVGVNNMVDLDDFASHDFNDAQADEISSEMPVTVRRLDHIAKPNELAF